ncbi:hypothetical protein BN1051_02284 [Arthrobacter saudimassiliensis]|uniref:Uncharacterized protein n=1 Tax=Arthrobacter saudimassiliensis TaxID=1461584 RepID=A0A078MRL0_9MICC|nr:hypothetical protein BN1051_02284 [Arthrobacter saudimassiliensis]
MKYWSLALGTAAALIAVVAASFWNEWAVAGVSAAAAAAVGLAWPHLLDIPARKSQGVALALVGVGSVAGAAFAPPTSLMSWMPAAAAVGVGAIFLIQLLRGTGQAHRLESTIGAVSGALVVVLGSGWVALDRLPHLADGGLVAAVAGAAGALVALAAAMIPLPDRMLAPLGVLAGIIASGLAAFLLDPSVLLPCAVIGAVGAAVIMAVRRLVLSRDEALNLGGKVAVALGPVLVLGAGTYFLGRLLLP